MDGTTTTRRTPRCERCNDTYIDPDDPLARCDCVTRLFLARLRDDLRAAHTLTSSDRPVQRERLQFAVWRARKALASIEFAIDEPRVWALIEQALADEIAAAQ